MPHILRTASTWLKIALGCMGVGIILYIIGFATTSWMVASHNRRDYSNNGLWQYTYCTSGCRTASYADTNSYHQAIQAMECIGFVGLFLAIVTLILYLCMDSCRRRDFLQAATAFTFAGIIFTCIGYAIFGSNDNMENENGRGREIGWSMGIAIAGTVFYGIAGLMLILQLIGK